jgi:TolB protein
MVMTWLLMLAVMIGSSPAAHAELLIRITEGADSAIPVAVVPFAESGTMPSGDKISSIVRDDLTGAYDDGP